MHPRVLLVGIDEAGYGPILGPLVVSAAAFEAPASSQDESLWAILRSSVSSTASVRDARIAILDSKKLFKPQEGLARLERSVLATVRAWRGSPADLRGLLNLLAPAVLPQLAQYPWYRDANPPLPRQADAGAVRIAGAGIKRDLEANDLRLAGAWSEVLPEEHYNRLIGRTQNKAVLLLGLTFRLVQRVAEAYPDRQLRFFIDKHGARDHYGRVLLRNFEDRRLKVVEEGRDRSEYELVDGRSAWRVSFHAGGESQHLPVALASMVSKYVRELLMECFNEYWLRHVPALRPTAGYYTDGLRFLAQIGPHLGRLGVTRNQLVRDR